MIYTISEWAATILECALLFWFLIAALSYKELSVPKKFIGTSAFFVLLNSIIFFFNYWYVIEGWYTLFYIHASSPLAFSDKSFLVRNSLSIETNLFRFAFNFGVVSIPFSFISPDYRDM